MIHTRNFHKSEVMAFLLKNFPNRGWKITLPSYGTGNESYFARCDERFYFIKLGVHTERYKVMSELGLSPQLVMTGCLEDGISIILQQKISGRKPTRKDFRDHLEKFAFAIGRTHQSQSLKQILPQPSSEWYKDAGLETLAQIERRWELYKSRVPASAGFVDNGIEYLRHEVGDLQGGGLVASHNDICNGNWLVSTNGNVYLLDYESMSRGDPALDLGAILWWYYPPVLRNRFLDIAGYENNDAFRHRMKIRMAMHCLHIILPREDSFDEFQTDGFEESLVDFRAVLDGKENPQGYMN